MMRLFLSDGRLLQHLSASCLKAQTGRFSLIQLTNRKHNLHLGGNEEDEALHSKIRKQKTAQTRVRPEVCRSENSHQRTRRGETYQQLLRAWDAAHDAATELPVYDECLVLRSPN